MTKIELPPLPEQVAHVHSNGDFCSERQIRTTEWPANLFTEAQMTAYALLAVEQERARCIRAVESERLEDSTGTEGDLAYGLALDHAIAAIRQSS